jgi:hypothetical protein
VNSLDPVHSVQVAAVFVWLGVVLTSAVVQAPPSLRGVGVAVGAGIGRVAFAALTVVEALLALALVVCVIGTGLTQPAAIVLGLLVAAFAVQLAGLRRHRPVGVLGDTEVPRGYVLLELAKIGLLLALGVLLLSGGAH